MLNEYIVTLGKGATLIFLVNEPFVNFRHVFSQRAKYIENTGRRPYTNLSLGRLFKFGRPGSIFRILIKLKLGEKIQHMVLA